MVSCPSCEEEELYKEISLKGSALTKKKKIITFYCPSCSFENQHEFELSRDDYEIELKKKKSAITKAGNLKWIKGKR